ncbi:MAG: SNF2 helicase associated domain-containing protein, partial [Chthoniobacterales bacterium]
MVALTEKLLQSACGWQAFKEAKSLLNAGKVLEANYAPPLLKGRVGGDGRIYASGLKINSPTDMDNLCTCRDSRDRGILCAHSIAVGLATLFVGNKTASAGGNISISQSSDSPQQTTAAVSEDIPKTSIHLEGSLNHLTAVVKFSYTDLKTRNPDFEKRVLESLSKEGFQQTRDGLRLDGEKPILRFLTSGKEKLKARADTVLGERIQRLTANVVQIEPRVAIRDTGLPGVFDANLSFTAGSDAIFSASDIRKLLQSGNTHVTLKNGKTAVMNEEVFEDIQEMLRDCDPEQSSNSFRIRSVYRKFFEESVSQWTQKAGPKKPSQPLGSLA